MMYGPGRLLAELVALGHKACLARAGELDFAIVSGFDVQVGRFTGRTIEVGLPATPDFPRSVGSAVHVLANPQLLEFEHVPGVRNIIASPLGPAWRYWSHNFNWAGERERSAARLMAQVNSIFERA